MQDDLLPKSLRCNILHGIRSEEKRIVRRQLVVSVVVLGTSVGAIAVSIKYALFAFYQSSFYFYATLLFSDPDIVVRYWREFGFALLESLPVVGVMCCLVAVYALLMSLRLLARNMRFGFAPSFIN